MPDRETRWVHAGRWCWLGPCDALQAADAGAAINVQFSGGPEWLEANVGKRFQRNWVSDRLNNLSCRIFPSAAVVRHQSWGFTRSSTTFYNCSIWAANGSSCRLKRIAKVVLKFTTREFTALVLRAMPPTCPESN